MQLKLSVGSEMLRIDVQPSDTFQDISERLYSLGNIKVDLKQLRSTNNDKPFDMTTNVMEYFNKTPKNLHAMDYFNKPPKDMPLINELQSERGVELTDEKNLALSQKFDKCRLCGEMVVDSPHFLFDAPASDHEVTLAEKVNTALPIYVTRRDPYPKSICANCLGYVDKSYDFMRMVLAAQNTLDNRVKKVEHMFHSHKDERCPLCNSGHLKSVSRKLGLPQHASSKKQGVTVQVPKPGLSQRTSHRKGFFDDDDSSQTEFYQNDEVVTGYWEPPKASSSSVSSDRSSSYTSGSSKKYHKKRIKTEDDHDWTIDEEYVPVSRRGRPKGTKNKPKIVSVIQKTCVLCDWTGSDLDMLAHTINLHCQPDLDYFPCPMCRTRHANEIELEAHIEEHTSSLRK